MLLETRITLTKMQSSVKYGKEEYQLNVFHKTFDVVQDKIKMNEKSQT